MIRISRSSFLLPPCLPRMRGDDPRLNVRILPAAAFAPHARG